jgi:hypothetical protein
MPFERVDGSLFIEGIPGQMVAAVVARAAVVNVPGEGPCPLLLLKFVRADGMTDAVEVALALTPDQMVNAGEMLHQAAAAAAAAAREAAA